jgi:spore coat polysaccharide biosynthesis protein SpsF (cytidylyltransferase family)
MELSILLITQARLGSTRLPGKILKSVGGKSLLEIHLSRLIKSRLITDFLVATTTNEEDAEIYDLSLKLNYKAYRGSEEDVLDRFYQAAREIQPDWVVRVTSDCPLIDAKLVDSVIKMAIDEKADYCSNTLIEEFPDGQDTEVFTFEALEYTWMNAKKTSEREHVTPYMKNNSSFHGKNLFKGVHYPGEKDYSNIRMTVDEPEDLEMMRKLVSDLGTDRSWQEYTDYMIEQNLTSMNEGIIRNEGYIKSVKKDES